MRAWWIAIVLASCTHDFTVIEPPIGECEPPYEIVEIDDGIMGCYRVVATPATWLAAEEDCEADGPGAHLAVVDSVVEHEQIHALTPGNDAWLGYTDRAEEGTFQWVTAAGGVDAFADECFFGPAVNAEALDCVSQDGLNHCDRNTGDHDWFFRGCDDARTYICERDGRDADPARY